MSLPKRKPKNKRRDADRCSKSNPQTGSPCILSKEHTGFHVSIDGTYDTSKEDVLPWHTIM